MAIEMFRGFLSGSVGKESACNAGDLCSVPGWVRSPGEGNGNTFQYSYLENPMDRGAWQPTRGPESQKLENRWCGVVGNCGACMEMRLCLVKNVRGPRR